jgi:hypothetical protein
MELAATAQPGLMAPASEQEPFRVWEGDAPLETAASKLGMAEPALTGVLATLGEAARQLGARLRRHQAELAAGLLAAVERGQGLVAQAEQNRTRRITELDRAAALLQRTQATLGAR